MAKAEGRAAQARHRDGAPETTDNARARLAARAELRRRRATAYRHLRTHTKRGRVLQIVLIGIAVVAAIGAGAVGAVFAGYDAYKGQLPDAATITGMGRRSTPTSTTTRAV